MPMSDARWRAITESQYPWEREALAFVRERLPDHEPYRAWANFEFIAEQGNVYEVDLLVLTPKGFYLVEIKSRPGVLAGDSHTWTWTQEGRRYSYDNPLILADRKAKRLKSILSRQPACRKVRVPFLQPVVFCSAADLVCKLDPPARRWVFTRDRDAGRGSPERPGIVAALTRWTADSADRPGRHRIDRLIAKAISRAMDEAGIRPSQRARRVGDYVLGEMLAEGPAYQDWSAEHATAKGVRARVRLYPLALRSTEQARETIARAAEREFRILQGVHHPGILRAEGFTSHERGPALIFEHNAKAVRLDHFLLDRATELSVDVRMSLLRQIAEALRYAHDKKLVHRALSPQSVLILDPDSAHPRAQVFNWHAGVREAGTTTGGTGVSGTVHADQLVEDLSLVYMAPEVIAGTDAPAECADVFSLGAIAYTLFSNSPPANSLLQRDERLRAGHGLYLSAAMDGVGQALRDLVLYSTCPELPNRLDSVEDFLELLETVEEELTAPDEESVGDPANAKVNDRLPGGFVVRKRLGRGSCSVAFLVERDGTKSVLKVAAGVDHNDRLLNEADVLAKLRHPQIVEFRETVSLGDRTAILMASAGEETLGHRIRTEGPLHLDLLRLFGEEILQVVAFLEESGIAHRDIKPDNIGLTPGTAKKKLHAVLFDFSLSRTPAENIRAGTRPYLDPFLSLRKPPRWDHHAERFAAAMTLYEMAAGSLPRWGDGQSDPALIDAEVSLDTELFVADLREPLSAFFARALRRDYRERFDTCEQMLQAWRRIFETTEARSGAEEEERAGALAAVLEATTPEMQLAALPLSTRVFTAMDRLHIATVGDLLRVPRPRILHMRGVGHKTRREIDALLNALRRRCPAIEPAVEVAEGPAPHGVDHANASVDLLLKQILPAKARSDSTEPEVLRLVVALDRIADAQTPEWPSQTEVATARGVTRARVGQVLTRARKRWQKSAALTALRAELVTILDAQGGVMTAGELARAVLSRRGSARLEPGRSRAAMAVARTAVETERSLAGPRFLVRRSADRVFVARELELADYATRLGRVADDLATDDPLPGPGRVREHLEAVTAPPGVRLEASRLVQLAAAASQNATVSSRFELYPRGMPAARAIKLAHGALLGGGELTVEQIHERVAARYPHAETLPGRPALDELIRDAGWDFEWQSSAVDGRGAYRARGSLIGTVTSGASSLSRHPTGGEPGEITPEVATARQFEDRLQHAARNGAFLALTVAPRHVALADRVLAAHFPLTRRSLEELFLHRMHEVAAEKNVDWNRVLDADGEPGEGKNWRNLMGLVRLAVPRIKEDLASAQQTVLLTCPGLLARYDAIELVTYLQDRVNNRNGLHGAWLLIPSNDQQAMPAIDGKAVPVITAGQWARIPVAWLQNLHRAGD